MVQSKRMIQALKRVLKERRVSYEQVSRHLGLSLSSVKRLFSTGSFTLQRLEAVCDLADVDLLELARQAEALQLRVASLTAEQERELIGDPVLLLVGICVLNRWRFERIVDHYQISKPRLIQLLVRLDRMGLIELLPGNRIKLRTTLLRVWPSGLFGAQVGHSDHPEHASRRCLAARPPERRPCCFPPGRTGENGPDLRIRTPPAVATRHVEQYAAHRRCRSPCQRSAWNHPVFC